MIEKEDIISFLKEKKEEFFVDFQVIKIGIFGSFAKNEQSGLSDIDLLVEFKADTPELAKKKARLKSIIKQRFDRDVDISREKYLKPYFRSQVLQSVIYV